MKKLKLFESFLNEGSHSDFIMSRSGELKTAIEQLKAMGKVQDKFTDEIFKKITDRLDIYDDNVGEQIDNWIFATKRGRLDVDDIVSFAMQNQDRFGTEAQMVINAIGDAYDVVCQEIKETPEIGEVDEAKELVEPAPVELELPVEEPKKKMSSIKRFEDFTNENEDDVEGDAQPGKYEGKDILPDWVTADNFGEPVKDAAELKVGSQYIIYEPGMDNWQAEYEYEGMEDGAHKFSDQSSPQNENSMDFSEQELNDMIGKGEIINQI